MSLILEKLFLGGKSDAKNLEFLVSNGITHVLNVTPTRVADPVAGVPNYFEKDGRFTYKRLPIYDNTSQSLSVYLDGCVTFIKEGHCHGKVLVHCAQGVSRSASVVLAFLMAELKMGLDEALAHCRRSRPQVKPNDTFMQQLREYGRKFKRAHGAPIGPLVFQKGPAVALDAEAAFSPEASEAAASTSAGAAVLPPALCEECETRVVALRCLACSVWYCQRCCDAVHDTSLLDHVCTFMPVGAAVEEDADVPAGEKRRKIDE